MDVANGGIAKDPIAHEKDDSDEIVEHVKLTTGSWQFLTDFGSQIGKMDSRENVAIEVEDRDTVEEPSAEVKAARTETVMCEDSVKSVEIAEIAVEKLRVQNAEIKQQEIVLKPLALVVTEAPPSAVAAKPASKQSSACLGIILVLLSAFLFSLSSAVVEWLSSISAVELSLFRFIGMGLPALCVMIYRRDDPFPQGYRRPLVLLGVFGFVFVISSFYAFQHMPIGDASALVFSSPIFTFIISFVYLKEPCRIGNLVAVFLSITGIILVAQPEFLFHFFETDYGISNGKHPYLGMISGLVGAMSIAVIYVIYRVVKDIPTTSKSVHVSLLPVLGCLSLRFISHDWTWPRDSVEAFAFFGIALTSYLGNMALTMSLKYLAAGSVSIARTSDIYFAYIWQHVFFKQEITLLKVVGCAFIVLAVVLSYYAERPPKRVSSK